MQLNAMQAGFNTQPKQISKNSNKQNIQVNLSSCGLLTSAKDLATDSLRLAKKEKDMFIKTDY